MRPSKFTIALLLVIAVGIGGTYGAFVVLSDPGEETDVATVGTETVVFEGSVEANVSQTLARVGEIRGYEAPTPARVEVDAFTAEASAIRRFRVLGLEAALDPPKLAYRWRLSGSSDSVVELTNGLSPSVQAVALAGAAERIYQENADFAVTDPTVQNGRFYDYDAAWAARIVTHGAATYVEDVFWERAGRPGARPITFYRTVAERSPAAHRATAPERLGYAWVSSQVRDPANLDVVYEDPPRRTAEILHPDANRSYPTMRVKIEGGTWTADQRVRLGELVTRFVLETQLSHEQASTAAAGWADDRLVEFLGGEDEQGFVWVVRMHSGAEAEEFVGALRDYLGKRAASVGEDRWSSEAREYALRRPSTETVALVLGPSSFLDATEITVNGTVTIHS